jgi:hypothetical protein
MLRDLESKGLVKLPAALTVSRKAGLKITVKHVSHSMIPVSSSLRELTPLAVEAVNAGAALEEFKSLIDQYHYLGFDRTIGENMKYIARSNSGAPLACLLYGSAAWACAGRDAYIGWDSLQRKSGLPFMTNNTRFLILPWVSVPHLASHILGLTSRRISRDWEWRYGHGLFCLETFVERGRFAGTCYKAANWQLAGHTAGRGRNSAGAYDVRLPEKDVYVYPLVKDFKEKLSRGAG